MLDKLRPEIAKEIKPLFDEVLSCCAGNVHSIHMTGSAITPDFDTKRSDINSIFVLKEMDLKFLEILAPKGKKFRKRKVAAPLIMTPTYIKRSLDVFPIEFLNFRLIHETVYGEDVLAAIEIAHSDLRSQCERELKVKLIGLRQGYLASMGDAKAISEGLVGAITVQMPLFRGIISLFGKTPPIVMDDVLEKLQQVTDINCEVYWNVLNEKRQKGQLSLTELNSLFKEYYSATEKLGKVVDEIKA